MRLNSYVKPVHHYEQQTLLQLLIPILHIKKEIDPRTLLFGTTEYNGLYLAV